MNSKSYILAAIAGCVVASCNTSQKNDTVPVKEMTSSKGECHGINSCKGKGECGGEGNSCAGTNSCKGKGWKTLTKEQCMAKKGTFKPEPN